MSTPTEHLGLHQWEAGDDFLRTDFNEDFAKIDAEAKLVRALAEQTSTGGSYTIQTAKTQNIELGFRPKLVLLFCPDKREVGFITEDVFFTIQYSVNTLSMGNNTGSSITDNGFCMREGRTMNNYANMVVHYIAFR